MMGDALVVDGRGIFRMELAVQVRGDTAIAVGRVRRHSRLISGRAAASCALQ
jgi:hypothetical protein